MKYQLFSEGDNNCVRSSLKSVLCRRGIALPSDEEFAGFFPRVANPEGSLLTSGAEFDIERLNKFLEQYSLQSSHFRPDCSIIEPDTVLEEAVKNQQDILAAFYFNSLSGFVPNKMPWRHVAMVEEFQYPNLKLHDYMRLIGLDEMRMAMKEDSRCGFYLIDKR